MFSDLSPSPRRGGSWKGPRALSHFSIFTVPRAHMPPDLLSVARLSQRRWASTHERADEIPPQAQRPRRCRALPPKACWIAETTHETTDHCATKGSAAQYHMPCCSMGSPNHDVAICTTAIPPPPPPSPPKSPEVALLLPLPSLPPPASRRPSQLHHHHHHCNGHCRRFRRREFFGRAWLLRVD